MWKITGFIGKLTIWAVFNSYSKLPGGIPHISKLQHATDIGKLHAMKSEGWFSPNRKHEFANWCLWFLIQMWMNLRGTSVESRTKCQVSIYPSWNRQSIPAIPKNQKQSIKIHPHISEKHHQSPSRVQFWFLHRLHHSPSYVPSVPQGLCLRAFMAAAIPLVEHP